MSITDFNNTIPAAPAGKVNVKWQADAAGTDPRHISAYVDAVLPNFADAETPSGTITGTSFTLAHTPNPAASLILVSDGTTLAPAGVGFTLTGASLALVSAPAASLLAWYRY